jgi:hypothetical protein
LLFITILAVICDLLVPYQFIKIASSLRFPQ